LIRKSLQKKLRNIKIILSDIDGVLTDGGMYYSTNGEIMKKFNTKDGMGIELLKQIGIETILITKENSKISKMRAKKMKVNIFSGVIHKENTLDKICKKYGIFPENMAYIGDDLNDLEIMKKVGFSATPKDGVDKIKKNATYICSKIGGDGVFREISDMILISKQFNS
jgi:YrbI family 3-deoxy-D-manno-octulosonate 8-phosphate phosphatase